jgi:hypothetical protein
MALIMKKDVTFDPVDVGLLSPQAVMFHPKDFSDLIEELGHVRNFTAKSGFLPHFCG